MPIMINDSIKIDPNKSIEENDKDQNFKVAISMAVLGMG